MAYRSCFIVKFFWYFWIERGNFCLINAIRYWWYFRFLFQILSQVVSLPVLHECIGLTVVCILCCDCLRFQYCFCSSLCRHRFPQRFPLTVVVGILGLFWWSVCSLPRRIGISMGPSMQWLFVTKLSRLHGLHQHVCVSVVVAMSDNFGTLYIIGSVCARISVLDHSVCYRALHSFIRPYCCASGPLLISSSFAYLNECTIIDRRLLKLSEIRCLTNQSSKRASNKKRKKLHWRNFLDGCYM